MEISLNSSKDYKANEAPKKDFKTKVSKNNESKDIYNDSPLRKLGFTDEIGAALKPVLATSSNAFVRSLPSLAFVPATVYLVSDVADKYKKGEDGTGEKPSVKMAAREAAYQGITSILAPVGIAKAAQKVTQGAIKKVNPEGKVAQMAKGAVKSLKSTKGIGKLLSKPGMPSKIAGAAVSILAITTLTKPVDALVGKFFNKVVDPKLGIKEDK